MAMLFPFISRFVIISLKNMHVMDYVHLAVYNGKTFSHFS